MAVEPLPEVGRGSLLDMRGRRNVPGHRFAARGLRCGSLGMFQLGFCLRLGFLFVGSLARSRWLARLRRHRRLRNVRKPPEASIGDRNAGEIGIGLSPSDILQCHFSATPTPTMVAGAGYVKESPTQSPRLDRDHTYGVEPRLKQPPSSYGWHAPGLTAIVSAGLMRSRQPPRVRATLRS
eukprot:scaffold238952_cov40-Prasinocladus_malaysianus.AAC.1